MILFNEVTISYGKHTVIDRLNLTWNQGAVHGLVGLNGSGKTTLLNGVFGLKSLQSGSILRDGNPISKREIAFLETSNFFYSNITGQEYLQLFLNRNKSFDLHSWNELFQLPLKKLIHTYSTGMRKKLAFLGILCLDTPILILDEPYNGVDMETSQNFKLIMKALRKKGKTIILTSHIFESLTGICDSISYLQHGKIQFTVQEPEFHAIEERIFGETNLKNEKTIKALMGYNTDPSELTAG